MKASSKTNPCLVVVHHHGDTNIARAGMGKTSRSASSTNNGLIAAQNAVRKYFGPRAHISLWTKQAGSSCTSKPTIYIATAIGGAS